MSRDCLIERPQETKISIKAKGTIPLTISAKERRSEVSVCQHDSSAIISSFTSFNLFGEFVKAEEQHITISVIVSLMIVSNKCLRCEHDQRWLKVSSSEHKI